MTSTTRDESRNATHSANERLVWVEHSPDFPARYWLTLDPTRPPSEEAGVEVAAVASPSRRIPVLVLHADEDASPEN